MVVSSFSTTQRRGAGADLDGHGLDHLHGPVRRRHLHERVVEVHLHRRRAEPSAYW